MYALAILAHAVAVHTTSLPLVLDGCSTASAIDAAEIRELDPAAPETVDRIADLLRAPDGATCLMESWVLVRAYRAQPEPEVVAHALAAGLASDAAHIAARAARLVRVLGVADPAAFAAIIHRPELTTRAWGALRTELGAMAPSPRKAELAAALAVTSPTATAGR